MKLDVELIDNGPAQQPMLLPQAELLKGANGYILAIQVNNKVFSLSIPLVLDLIAKQLKANEGTASEEQPKA